MSKVFILPGLLSLWICNSFAQSVNITGKVVNPDENPVYNALVYLSSNPALSTHSDSLGFFSIAGPITTYIPEVSLNEVISFENRKLSLQANNQSVAVDVINMNGIVIKQILYLNKRSGTIELFPEAYLSDQPKAIYLVRARVGNTVRSFKIQNLILPEYPMGMLQYNHNELVDNDLSDPGLKSVSATYDTLILVHDYYRVRKIPLESYSVQIDTIHLNNFADYSLSEGFEPSITQLYNRYANFTDVLSADSVQFIIDYDTLSVLGGDLKTITIPVDNLLNLDPSVEFISGLHLEPSGTEFLQPVQVSVFLKDPIPADLVVFHINEHGETNYIPYDTLLSDGYSIIFNLHHFSSIGIGTGEIPAANPEEFTSTDQFISYFALLLNNNESVPEGIFTMWYLNIIDPVINNINTTDDLEAAMKEFVVLQTYYQVGGENFNQSSLYMLATEKFSVAMEMLYEDLVNEYNHIEDDNCLKREIIIEALRIQTLQNYFPDLYTLDINRLNNGEYWRLAIKIEFPKSIKTMDVGASYQVNYNLVSPSDSINQSDSVIPEDVSWRSSNPAVATVDSTGVIHALSDGTTTIRAELCMIESELQVIVGDKNCEENFCNRNYSCYDGVYQGTGVLEWFQRSNNCITKVTEHIGVLINLGNSDVEGYIESSRLYKNNNWDNRLQGCVESFSVSPPASWGFPVLYCYDIGKFSNVLFGFEIDGILTGQKLLLHISRYEESFKSYFRTVIWCEKVGI